MPPNDRGYGHGRFAGVFPVVKRQKEMRAQNPLSARQPACDHRRVLGAAFLLSISFNTIVECNLHYRNKQKHTIFHCLQRQVQHFHLLDFHQCLFQL